MGKPHPLELRQRVVKHVEAGNSHRSAAARFDVSVKFVNDMVKLKRETGSLSAKRQGNPGIGKLTPYADWVRERIADKGDLTLDELVDLRIEVKAVKVHRTSVSRLLHRLGLSHKKRLSGS